MSKKSKRNRSKKRLRLWVSGARLRTLPLAIAPVLLGVAVALARQKFSPLLSLLALAVSLLLQVGVNYANDYSDGIRGTDKNRVGPARLTGGGLAKPKAVRNAAFICFGVAAISGLAIVVITQQWWLIAVGLVCVIAAWYYTGGKHPYGYAGLGEIAVFVFFGLVATIGTDFIQELDVNPFTWVLAVNLGLFASAVLMVNNIRDINTDITSGKRTLAVKVGRKPALAIFFAMLWLPMVFHVVIVLLFPNTILGYASLLLILPITLIVSTAKTPRALILALKLTSYAALLYAVLVAWSLNF